MYNAGKIIPGLLLFLALATTPIWYNVAMGHEAVAPEIEKPTNSTACVADTQYMRREHMQLLNEWRDDVVRTGERVYVSGSLSGTYAQYALCRADQIHPLPDALSFAQGACLATPYATAFRALFQKTVARPGETVLVHGRYKC